MCHTETCTNNENYYPIYIIYIYIYIYIYHFIILPGNYSLILPNNANVLKYCYYPDRQILPTISQRYITFFMNIQ